MSNTMMAQCKLWKPNDVIGDDFQVAWIPAKFAKIGKTLCIKGVDGWQVVEVWNFRPLSWCNERSQDYKHQRKMSDI